MFGMTGRSDKELFVSSSFEYDSQRESTTFWDDFSIADAYGKNGINDTFRRAFAGWKDNYKYLTELVMVLNHKCWQHHDAGNSEISELYQGLYEKAKDYGYDNLKGDEIKFFMAILD